MEAISRRGRRGKGGFPEGKEMALTQLAAAYQLVKQPRLEEQGKMWRGVFGEACPGLKLPDKHHCYLQDIPHSLTQLIISWSSQQRDKLINDKATSCLVSVVWCLASGVWRLVSGVWWLVAYRPVDCYRTRRRRDASVLSAWACHPPF